MSPTGNNVRDKCGLIEHVHDIALILRRISTTNEAKAVSVLLDSGVVARRDGIETELIGAVQQTTELHVTVALDARVGRDAHGVRGDVRVDHVLVEIVAEVEHQVVDIELLRNAARIVDIADAAATGIAVAAPQLHRYPNDLVTLLQQERTGH